MIIGGPEPTGFQPSLWMLVGVAVPSILIGLWALWDAYQPPKVRLSARLAIVVSLTSLIQWTIFLGVRAGGWWSAVNYERVAAPYRLLVLSPIGGWGIWFTLHWFARRSTRQPTPLPTHSGGRGADSGDRMGD